jgi:hypothetical protein
MQVNCLPGSFTTFSQLTSVTFSGGPPAPTPPTLSCASGGVGVGWDFDAGGYGPYRICGVTGSPAPTIKVISGSLPPGLTASVDNGRVIVHGKASVAGRYPFTLQASNGTAPDATASDTFDVTKCSPVLGNISWSQSAPGQPVTLAAHVDNAGCSFPATGQVRFILYGPEGYSLQPTAFVSGDGRVQVAISLFPGPYTAVAVYSGDDTHEVRPSPELRFVVPSTGASMLKCAESDGVAVGFDFDSVEGGGGFGMYTLCHISGDPVPTIKVISGSLPPGVTLKVDRDTVIVHGKASVAGRYPFTLQASNGASPDATASVTFDVEVF